MASSAETILEARPLTTDEAGTRATELFKRHGRMVLGLCRMLLRDPAEAEDATQQTFLSAYRSLLGGTEPRQPAAWLATIARNECWARTRERMREPLSEPDPEGPSDGPDPLDATIRKAELAAVWSAIEDLPPQQRDALVMREFSGLSYEELAETLDVTQPAVESLLFRARRELRVRLRPVLAPAFVAPFGAVREALIRLLGDSASVGAVAKIAAAPAVAKLAAGTAAVGLVAGGVVAVEPQFVTSGSHRPTASRVQHEPAPAAATSVPRASKQPAPAAVRPTPVVTAAPAQSRPAAVVFRPARSVKTRPAPVKTAAAPPNRTTRSSSQPQAKPLQKPAPVRANTAAPAKAKTPAPAKAKTPAPAKAKTPAPARKRAPVPAVKPKAPPKAAPAPVSPPADVNPTSGGSLGPGRDAHPLGPPDRIPVDPAPRPVVPPPSAPPPPSPAADDGGSSSGGSGGEGPLDTPPPSSEGGLLGGSGGSGSGGEGDGGGSGGIGPVSIGPQDAGGAGSAGGGEGSSGGSAPGAGGGGSATG